MRTELSMVARVACCLLVTAFVGCGGGSDSVPEAVEYRVIGSVDVPAFGELVNIGDSYGRYPHEPMVRDGKLFLPTGAWGIGVVIVDVGTPTKPRILTNYTGIRSRAIDFERDIMGSVSGNGLDIVDIANPASPRLLGSFELNAGAGIAAIGVSVVGDIAYVTGGGNYLGDFGALTTIDISDPKKPLVLGSSHEAGGADAFVIDNLAYVASYDDGLRIYDISDPDDIALIATVGTFGRAAKVRIKDGVAFVYNTGVDYSLTTIDISDPENPQFLGNASEPWSLERESMLGVSYVGMALIEDTVFLATSRGIDVVDVTDPREPTLLGRITTNRFTGGIAPLGPYVAVADTNSVYILDVKTARDNAK